MARLLKQDFKLLFETAPGLYLVLAPDLTIVTASDAYLQATMTKREEITGHGLFEIFPDNPDDNEATGVSNLRASLNFVLEKKAPHTMAIQKYDIRRPDGTFEERYWSPLNTPVLDDNKKVKWIIHRVEDVTEFVKLKNEESKKAKQATELQEQLEKTEIEVYKRAQEIQETNKKLLTEVNERKKLEEQLKSFNESLEKKVKEKTEELTGFFERITDGFIALDENYNYKYANKKIGEMTGRDPQSLIGKNVWEEFPDAVNSPTYKAFTKAMKEQHDIINIDYYPGLELWQENRIYPSPDGLSIFIRDITKQKKGEQQLDYTITQLKDSEEKYKSLFTQSPLPKWIYDLETLQFLEVNEAASLLYGYAREEFLSMTIKDIRPKEEVSKLLEDVKKIGPDTGTIAGTWNHIKKNGELMIVETTAHSIEFENKKARIVAVVDITEKIKIAEQLGYERNLLRSLIDNLPAYIYVKDIDSHYIITNRSFINLVGAGSEEETIGKNVADFFQPDLAATNSEEDKIIFQTGHPVINREESVFSKKGEQIWMLTSKVVLKNEDGTIKGLIGISRDITEIKQAEFLLQELNSNLEKRAAELAASNTELERFAYVASHDLQEPLRMVSSFLELLEKKIGDKLDESSKKYIHYAVDGSERMKKLIQDLLQYSRVGTNTESFIEVDMNETLDTVRSVLGLSIYEKKAVIEVKSLPKINAVKPQMLQLFQNLIGNALKYCAADKAPHIEVGCRDIGKMWQFYVKDNGIGIEPRFFEKVFIIFQRLHNRSEYSGTGIGLAICKKIVERHSGKIWVESEPGNGSIFYIELPKKDN